MKYVLICLFVLLSTVFTSITYAGKNIYNGRVLDYPDYPRDGVSVRIYNDSDFKDLRVSKIDTEIDYNWKDGSPSPEIEPDMFTVVWDGTVLSPEDGEYTFLVNSDDGIRLYVNNILIIDQWHDADITEYSGVISLCKNKAYSFRLEYYEHYRNAAISVYWKIPGQEKQLLSTPYLSTVKASDAPKDIWVMDFDRLTEPERVFAISLQGLVSKHETAVWVKQRGLSRHIRKKLESSGVRFHDNTSPWFIFEKFSGYIDGYVLCDSSIKSTNSAISLSGPLNAVVVQEDLIGTFISKSDMERIIDVRDFTPQRTINTYRNLFGHELLVDQTRPDYLMDLAVARNAYTFANVDSKTRQVIVKVLASQGMVFGWASTGGEDGWVADLSKANASGIAADWSRNLSVLSRIPAEIPAPPKKYPDPALEGERIVAFVMSDGDNMQFMGGDFIDNKKFFGSPYRGQFSMTWEFPPVMADLIPSGVSEFYSRASKGFTTDCFIAGPSGVGYAFHHYLSDRAMYAADTAEAMKKCGLKVVTLLNADEGDMSEADELLDRAEIMGAVYKEYGRYDRLKGQIHWHNGKPVVSYKYLLWQKLEEYTELAKAVAQMPSSPTTDMGSYALVNVHAWSYGDIGGPMEALKRTVSQLPENTRIVTVEEMIILLRNNFGTPLSADEYYKSN